MRALWVTSWDAKIPHTIKFLSVATLAPNITARDLLNEDCWKADLLEFLKKGKVGRGQWDGEISPQGSAERDSRLLLTKSLQSLRRQQDAFCQQLEFTERQRGWRDGRQECCSRPVACTCSWEGSMPSLPAHPKLSLLQQVQGGTEKTSHQLADNRIAFGWCVEKSACPVLLRSLGLRMAISVTQYSLRRRDPWEWSQVPSTGQWKCTCYMLLCNTKIAHDNNLVFFVILWVDPEVFCLKYWCWGRLYSCLHLPDKLG